MTWVMGIFWNTDERRLRAGWRILIQLAFWIMTPALLGALLGNPIALFVTDLFPDLSQVGEKIAFSSLTLIAVLLSTWFVVRFIDHRPLADLGLRLDRDWWWDLSYGLVLGAVLMTLIFGAEYALGWVDVTSTFAVGVENVPFAIAMLQPIVLFIVVGITEEILSRGYQLRNLAEGLNMPIWSAQVAIILAWILSSSLFGLLHIFNPNSTIISTVNLMLAGVFLGLGFVLTGRLGLPIGLHITWNFFQGNVYGFPVSGNVFPSATFIAIEQRGPTGWTGGAFGPEAGLIGIVAILIGCVLTLLWVQLRYKSIRLYTPLACYQRGLPFARQSESVEQGIL